MPRTTPTNVPEPVPATRLAALRILTGAYATGSLVVLGPDIWRIFGLEARRWAPVGVVGWVSEPPPAALLRAVLVITIVAGVGYTVGWRYRVTGPAFAALLLVVTTARNSWGQVWHTENLVVLHVAILALAPAAAAWSADTWRSRRDARIRDGSAPTVQVVGAAWVPLLMSVATVTTYAIAGVTKLREGGLDWVVGDVLRNQVAYDNVRKAALGATHSPIAGLVLDRAWLFVPMAWATLAVELGAPLALLGRAWARVWVVAAWLFHLGVLALMAISFPYPLLGVAFASFFPVERIAARARAYRPVPARARTRPLAPARAGRRD